MMLANSYAEKDMIKITGINKAEVEKIKASVKY